MTDGLKYKFSGHQTFTFRYGWLQKGFNAVEKCSTVFSEDDALVQLGVGKNMVTSIKYWCHLTQLVELDQSINRNTGRYLRSTDLGRRLLGKKGWDQFLENESSLWLLHWLIVSNRNVGSTWKLLFTRFLRPDFSKQDLLDFLMLFVNQNDLKARESVINRDVDCFLRTYVTSNNNQKFTTPEEAFSCPLLNLNLIQLSPDGELYRFGIGPKPSLSTAVFAFALHEHFENSRSGRNTMSIQECLYGECSPGQVFKLDENSLIEYIEHMGEITNGALVLDETAGLKQIYRLRDFDPIFLLDQHFGGENTK